MTATPDQEPPGSPYLEEAAALLHLAREDNERRWALAAEVRDVDPRGAQEIDAEAAARSLVIAEGFTRLAAIAAGLPPCYHAQPEQEQPS
jgi:hypothetical protein